MKKFNSIFLFCITFLLLGTGVCAANIRPIPKTVEISDIHNNELFEIVEVISLSTSNYNMDIYNASFAFWSPFSARVFSLVLFDDEKAVSVAEKYAEKIMHNIIIKM